RGDDEVEVREELVAEVDRAVGQDVRLRAVEDPEAGHPALESPDLLALCEDASFVEPSGLARGLAVIRVHRRGVTLLPGRVDHGLQRAPAVGPGGVDVDRAFEVLFRYERRERSRRRRFDLSRAFPKLRLDVIEAERAVD